jgi:hypothetical protein
MAANGHAVPDAWVAGPVMLPGPEVGFLKFTRAYAGCAREGYPKRATVSFKLLAPNESGNVSHEENAELEEVESSLVAAAGDDACYVGFSTDSGVRNYLFYAKSTEWLRAWGSGNRDEAERRTASVRVEDEPGWKTYHELLEMATDAMSDMQVLMKVMELDADMAEPRRVDWALVFPEESQARSALGELESEGLGMTLGLTRGGERTMLSASKVGVLDIRFMLYFNARMRSVAASNGGTFDGWGATVDAKRKKP